VGRSGHLNPLLLRGKRSHAGVPLDVALAGVPTADRLAGACCRVARVLRSGESGSRDTARVTAEDHIDAFWTWFADNSGRLSADLDAPVVLEELDQRVLEMGCPAWEIGPGDQAEWFLALSPDGDQHALPLTQQIVSRAPSISDWEFLPRRPRKKWDLRFGIEAESGPIEIDARRWRYVAYRYPDGLYDLVISVGNEVDLTDGDRELAVQIAVEGQLGEEAVLTRVNEVEAVVDLSTEQASRSQPLSTLGRAGLDE
jgi:hypothetical protein